MLIAKNVAGATAELLPKLTNRHGLIAGATGTGKTTTLKVLAEKLSDMGVPVFLADVKGDVTGICQPGETNDIITAKVDSLKLEAPSYHGLPTQFWDLFGEKGEPIRATVSEMGPLLLSRILDLNDTQESVLSVVFKIADDNGMLLLDLKDLRAMLNYVGEHANEFKTNYGNIASTTLGTIQRQILALENQHADNFFGEPALNLDDMIRTTYDGKGYVNLLAADKLMQTPKLYATFLLWLLSELFERLPEVGDPDKPKLVFFFDEAHLLFDDAPQILTDKILQVVRLIRSKGVGIYFITQNPVDIPDDVLGQLGNRIQHALRAYTPKEQKAIKQAAETYRTNPTLDITRVVQELEVGEALVSFLDAKGAPCIVNRYFIVPPSTHFGPAESLALENAQSVSPVRGKYLQTVDRESAYELIQKRVEATTLSDAPQSTDVARQTAHKPTPAEKMLNTAINTGIRTVTSSLGRELVRGILGGIFGTKR